MPIEVLRTPEERFASLPGFPYTHRYVEVGDALRVGYVDEGPPGGDVVLLLHGEPTWSYLYRKMIPVLVAAGLRAVAPDLVGFGRSDKPVDRKAYTYQRHVDWLREVVERLDLRGVTLFGQDWGGLIGLRVAVELDDRFDRIVAANTYLPTGDGEPNPAFLAWQRHSQEMPRMQAGWIVSAAGVHEVPADVVDAYDAPFPDERYMAGAREFPMLVPTRPDDPASAPNRAAWERLRAWRKPFLTVFGDSDPVTKGCERAFVREVPGAAGQPHVVLPGAGHFLQEDAGEEVAHAVVDFVRSTPAGPATR